MANLGYIGLRAMGARAAVFNVLAALSGVKA
jgi:hypothetical protein